MVVRTVAFRTTEKKVYHKNANDGAKRLCLWHIRTDDGLENIRTKKVNLKKKKLGSCDGFDVTIALLMR